MPPLRFAFGLSFPDSIFDYIDVAFGYFGVCCYIFFIFGALRRMRVAATFRGSLFARPFAALYYGRRFLKRIYRAARSGATRHRFTSLTQRRLYRRRETRHVLDDISVVKYTSGLKLFIRAFQVPHRGRICQRWVREC